MGKNFKTKQKFKEKDVKKEITLRAGNSIPV